MHMTQEATSTIVIYTHPDCAFSAAAKMDMRRRRVEYQEINLAKEPDKIPNLLALTNGERITPVLVEGDQVTIGFNGDY
jgi:glutaredoxin